MPAGSTSATRCGSRTRREATPRAPCGGSGVGRRATPVPAPAAVAERRRRTARPGARQRCPRRRASSAYAVPRSLRPQAAERGPPVSRRGTEGPHNAPAGACGARARLQLSGDEDPQHHRRRRTDPHCTRGGPRRSGAQTVPTSRLAHAHLVRHGWRGRLGRRHASRVGLDGAQARAATPPTPPSRRRPRSASPSPTAPASAAAATSSSSTRRRARSPRSTAARPRRPGITPDAFIDPATGQPYPFTPELVSSGVSVGVPGTVATWDAALDALRHQRSLERIARARHRARREGLPGRPDLPQPDPRQQGAVRGVPRHRASCSCPAATPRRSARRFRNPDLARTLRADRPARTEGVLHAAARRARSPTTVQNSAEGPGLDAARAAPARMTARDLAALPRRGSRPPTQVRLPRPRRLRHGARRRPAARRSARRSTSSRTTGSVGGSGTARACTCTSRRRARAFADRGAYVGDPAFVDVPTRTLLSQRFADSRDCTIDPTQASIRPVAPGALDGAGCATAAPYGEARHRERLDHAPLGRRQVGQRRRLHADDRADRRLGHHGARARLPAQQRADRLHRRVRRGRPEPHRAGQASALVDVADDRARRTAR